MKYYLTFMKLYKNHSIKQNSMLLAVSSGKVNIFLNRSSGSVFEIVVFTGSNKYEPLCTFLSQAIQGLQFICDALLFAVI